MMRHVVYSMISLDQTEKGLVVLTLEENIGYGVRREIEYYKVDKFSFSLDMNTSHDSITPGAFTTSRLRFNGVRCTRDGNVLDSKYKTELYANRVNLFTRNLKKTAL